jgi:RNA polymerase sigma factor (sigma-70 family)
MTDRELLAEYAQSRSGSAFAALVDRHAGKVFGACCRILGDPHAAEDATQAVFLVLARKAGGLPRGTVLSGWLFLAAEMTARQMLRARRRRERHEQEAALMHENVKPAAGGEDLRPHLDAALAALPAAQRNAVILRYLDGKSQAEVARELGCSESTVSAALSRALERLRGMLNRRGMGLSSAALGGMLAEQAGSAAVPATLLATLKGIGIGAGAAAISATAASLAEGTMKAMMIAKVKLAAAVIGAALVIGGGGSALVAGMAAAEPPKAEAPAAAEPLAPTPLPRGEGPGVRAERQGPLAALPSAPGSTVEKIKALGDNQWLNLGSPAADPKWGKACGRTWGSKALVLAPDLRGAFIFGEGLHAGLKADGYAMDDLWFYDINAHRWICLYPGMNPKTFTQRIKDQELKVDDQGRLADKDGQPIPVHTHVHAWGFLAYDTDQKKFIFWNGYGMNIGTYFLAGQNDMKPGLDLLAEQGLGKKNQTWSPWFYDTATGKFEVQPATGSFGSTHYSTFPKCVYVPSKKQYLVLSNKGDAVYDLAQRKWRMLAEKGLGGWDTVGCYDPKRDRVYHGNAAYDVASNTWVDLKATGERPASFGHNYTGMEYDTVNDAVVAIHYSHHEKPELCGVYVYSPGTNAWTKAGPLPPKGGGILSLCYDPELNAYFCYQAGDSDPNGTMWVYRYKRAAK